MLDLLLLVAAVQEIAGAAITDDPAKIKFLKTVLRVVGFGIVKGVTRNID
jgi:hypothetical protein